jgi:hypothetical protein
MLTTRQAFSRSRQAQQQSSPIHEPASTTTWQRDRHLAARPQEDTAEFVISAYHQLFQIDPGQAFPAWPGPDEDATPRGRGLTLRPPRQ